MATITTVRSGNWSDNTSGGPWPNPGGGGVAYAPPTNADDVIIAASHTVTIDSGCAAVCKSIVLNVGGSGVAGAILQTATGVGADMSLTVEQGISTGTAVSGGTRNGSLLFDLLNEAPYKFTLTLNNSRATGNGYGLTNYGNNKWRGKVRKRWTRTVGALVSNTSTGCAVDDATGWEVGDTIIFSSTLPYLLDLTIVGVSYSSGEGKLSVTLHSNDSNPHFKVGSEVILSSLNTALNGSWVVSDIVSDTVFKIAMSNPGTLDDNSGTVFLRARSSQVTITSVSYNAGTGKWDIAWTGTGTGGSVTYDHIAGCVAANYTSNLIIKGNSYGDSAWTMVGQAYGSSGDYFSNVLFSYLKTTVYGSAALGMPQAQTGLSDCSNNAFLHCNGDLFIGNAAGASYTFENNVFFTNAANSQGIINSVFYQSMNYTKPHMTDFVWQRGGCITIGAVSAQRIVRPKVSGMTFAIAPSSLGLVVEDGEINCSRSVLYGSYSQNPPVVFINCDVGNDDLGTGATNLYFHYMAADMEATLEDCYYGLSSTWSTRGNVADTVANLNSKLIIKNKNCDPAVQEIYTAPQSGLYLTKEREYIAPQRYVNSTSALAHRSGADVAIVTSGSVPSKSGEEVKVVGYLLKSLDYGAATFPSISFSGLSVTSSTAYEHIGTGAVATLSVTAASNRISRSSGSFLTDGFAAGDRIYVEGFTEAGNNGTKYVLSIAVDGSYMTVISPTTLVDESAGGSRAVTRWYQATLTGTQTTGADGDLTLSCTSRSAVAGAKAFFAGIPFPPFVTRCRHYGYTFDEGVAFRTTNLTVSANELTAISYAGIDVTWGASVSPIAISADRTIQELYDYTQAHATLNVASVLPLTGAGVAGSPSLFAKADITIGTGHTLSGAGSISMDTFDLTSEFASGADPGYTYTGGTWSQATTVPTFAGGTLTMGAAGTYTFTVAASTTIVLTPTSASTYNLSGGTFAGTITVNNAAAHAITVQVPAGATFVDTGNTGGEITFEAPQVYQSVTVNGLVVGSRLQIYDEGSADEELYNDIVGSASVTWTDSVAASAGADRDIRIRVSYVDGATAKEFIEANVGTCDTTEPGNAVTTLVSQVDDVVYNTNAIDGSAVTDITFVDAATDLVVCDIDGGSVTYKTIYAAFVYWNFTEAGIANDFTYISAPDTANYRLSGMKIRNTSVTDLVVTGGYGIDATSLASKDTIDTAGSTGNIFLAPDHVVPYSVGSGLTAGEQATLAAIGGVCSQFAFPATGLVAAQVSGVVEANVVSSSAVLDANIKQVNSIPVSGAGTEADPWGP